MEIEKIVKSSKGKDAALNSYLSQFLNPAFGALPKSEIELLNLELLISLGAISAEPAEYEMVSNLRITRSKARKLIYERELRRSSSDDLDRKTIELLKYPILQKNGDLFVLEVESPLLSDHLRAKIRSLGFVSDGSFSPTIVKLPLEAIGALIEEYLGKKEIEKVRRELISAGAPDTSFTGVLRAVARKLASKVATDSGEALVEHVSGIMAPIVEGTIDTISSKVSALFSDD